MPLRRSLVPFAPLAAALLAACSSATEPAHGPAPLAELPRPLTAAETSLRDANNRFAFTLFGRLAHAQPGENVLVSPLSVSTSLGMAMQGAAGNTRAEMQRTLGFGDADAAAIRSAYRELPPFLAGLDSRTSFRIANSIWYERNVPFRAAFLETGRTVFDAQVVAADFSDAEGTKRRVNDWVKEKTNGRIPTIVDQVRADDVMYLINAIWFKGSWRKRFDPVRTHDADFHLADGGRQRVKMMHHQPDTAVGLRVWSDGEVDALELPYGNGAYAMTIVMPRTPGGIGTLARGMSQAGWDAIVGRLAPARLDVFLPRFTLTYDRELGDDLKALGMRDAFSEVAADFSGMTDQRVAVSFVRHKTFIQVDEEGTEAAAVTNTGMVLTSLPPQIRVDRPFIYAIRERLTGTVLFLGKMERIPEG